MPALSPTMTEGNLTKWLKKEGDKVTPGDIIAEIETDKATMEVECIDEGTLGKIVVPAATPNVAVNQLIAVLVGKGEGEKEIKQIIDNHSGSFVQSKPQEAPTQHVSQKTAAAVLAPVAHEHLRASPLAKRIARDNNVDLSTLSGSGPKGRIIKVDVEGAHSAPAKKPRATAPAHDEIIPLSQMRKVIAKRLLESKQTVPHFYVSIECNVDKLLVIRADMNEQLADAGVKISVNDMIIKASALALRDIPEANAAWNEDSIIRYGTVDISIAVATDDGGLITPIVFAADSKGLSEISTTMKELAGRAKKNQLKPHEFQGGSFSISNLGMYNIDEFLAIVNPPQAGILAVGGAFKKPVVINDEIKIATIMKLSLSCDHRVIDGAIAARLLNRIKHYLEKPFMLLNLI